MSEPVRIFISYAWEDEEYQGWVQQLAAQLRQDGLHARLDLWDRRDGQSFFDFMSAEVEDADRVLVLASPGYCERVRAVQRSRGFGGVGLEWEVLGAELFRGGDLARLVVALTRGSLEELPAFLTREPVIDLSRAETLRTEYEALRRRLLGQRTAGPPVQSAVRPLDQPVVVPLLAAGARPAGPGQPAPSRLARQIPVARRDPRAITQPAAPMPADGATGIATRRQELVARQQILEAEREARLIRGEPVEPLDQELLRVRRELRAVALQPGELLRDGRYRLLEPIGEGGFAVVWRAYDQQDRRIVAIKVLRTQYAQDQTKQDRFFRGAREMARLTHPGIVRVLDRRCAEGELCYFVMDHLPGGDLRRAVQEGRIRPEHALPLCRQVGEALQHAHDQGLVHRDVKPANLLLDQANRPLLTDFDLVRAQDTTGGTRTGALGTWVYAAPEAMGQAAEVDHRADLYALAMTTLFVLHGQELPFRVLRNPNRFLARLSCTPEVRRILLRALEVTPANRWATVREFCEALAAAQTSPNPIPVQPFPGPDSPEGMPWIEPISGLELVWVPPGAFLRGSTQGTEGLGADPEAYADEEPAHRVELTQGFLIGRHLVTNVQYRQFLAATGHLEPGFWQEPRFNRPLQPVVGVDWEDARTFCRWLTTVAAIPTRWRFELPTEAQWERAARGTDGLRYPWGNKPPTPEQAVFGRALATGAPEEIGGRPTDASPAGCQDLAGNVWEWCLDGWSDSYHKDVAAGDKDPVTGMTVVVDPCRVGDTGASFLERRVVRGGSWLDGPRSLRCSCRLGFESECRSMILGLRVVCVGSGEHV